MPQFGAQAASIPADVKSRSLCPTHSGEIETCRAPVTGVNSRADRKARACCGLEAAGSEQPTSARLRPAAANRIRERREVGRRRHLPPRVTSQSFAIPHRAFDFDETERLVRAL
jgi:hypothetical protein